MNLLPEGAKKRSGSPTGMIAALAKLDNILILRKDAFTVQLATPV